MQSFGIGSHAPDFSLTLTDGKKARLNDITSGKQNTILFFYPSSSSYSKTCQEQAKAYNNYLTGLGGDIAIVGVSAAGVKEAKKFQEKFASSFPIGVIDKKVLDQYDVRNKGIVPKVLGILNRIFISKRVTFILDKDNTVVERIELPLAANGPEMTAHAKEISARIKEIRAVNKIADSEVEVGAKKEKATWQERSLKQEPQASSHSLTT